MIRVLLTGATGKMGREVAKAIHQASDMALVGAYSRSRLGEDLGVVCGLDPFGVSVDGDLPSLLERCRPDVVVDFTVPYVVRSVAETVLAHGARLVVGTTGLSIDDMAALEALALEKEVGLLIAPNFAIGALLLMQFAQKATQYFDHAEIIELHHNQKLDAPSGTALKTAETMLEGSRTFGESNAPELEKLEGVRGGNMGGIRIHSVRLPGLLAHQEVLLGAPGQVLTLRHDAMGRECFMPGVLLAIRKALPLKGLVYGLEHLL